MDRDGILNRPLRIESGTGVSQRADIGEIVPDGIYESLADLHAAWRDSRSI